MKNKMFMEPFFYQFCLVFLREAEIFLQRAKVEYRAVEHSLVYLSRPYSGTLLSHLRPEFRNETPLKWAAEMGFRGNGSVEMGFRGNGSPRKWDSAEMGLRGNGSPRKWDRGNGTAEMGLFPPDSNTRAYSGENWTHDSNTRAYSDDNWTSDSKINEYSGKS